MPRHLKLIARFANSGLIFLFAFIAVAVLAKGNLAPAVFFLMFATLLGFNLYLIEKAALLLSGEEWLKGEIRKALLHRKLKQLTNEGDTTPTNPIETDDPIALKAVGEKRAND